MNDIRKWEKRAEDLAFDQLPNIRSTAEKWVTTITTFTGLTSILALLQGREDISALETWAEVVVGILLGIALIAAISAIYSGVLASQGSPKPVLSDPDSVRRAYSVWALEASKNLEKSRYRTITAIVFLAIAIYFTWFGPTEATSETATNVVVIQRTGSVVCGELQAGTDGSLILKPKNTNMSSTPLNDVSNLNTIATCP